ncbi:PKD domain-containing protein [Adhaeribacter soli]|uniref:PKD domain-containing protein n=1 Tax=Adhaeribacter soli TaxID=2607655 RepID=A0A5N1J5D8_9BACT|nr:PKD domain-containing protein [Adhaeribacter soli]KAA9346121.1 PKD domain-containing protein [Adhaeribacter soli]
MKTLNSTIYYCILFLLLTAVLGCNKDEVGPQAGIMADKYLAEPGEEVTFTSTSTNLHTYEWDLGNGAKSNKKSVTTTFNTPGDYSVILKVKDINGKTSETSVTVHIGRFFISGASLVTLNFKDSVGSVWDTDGSGPDITLGFYPQGQGGLTWFIGNNITQKNLPAFLLLSDRPVLLFNNNLTVHLIENPENGQTGQIRTMKKWIFNPIKEIQKYGRDRYGKLALSGEYPRVEISYSMK